MSTRTAVGCLLMSVVVLAAPVPAALQAPVLAITGVNVVDVTSGRIAPNRTVTITGPTITAVTEGGAPAAGARVIDGRNAFLIPGLWDMHAHVEMTEESSLQLDLASGITGIRDMGSDLDLILRLRDATASGRVLGPHIVAAGPILDDAPGEWPFRLRVKNAQDGQSAVQMLKRRGVDLIKVHNYTPRDAFFAIADEARRQGLPLAGHVPLKVTVQEGIDAGMRSIEHLSEDGRVWKACSQGNQYHAQSCRPFFEMLARRKVWQTPTLVALAELMTFATPASTLNRDQFSYAGRHLREMWAENQKLLADRPEVIAIMKAQAATARVVTNDMATAGVGILAGCDALVPGFCLHDELSAMVSSGMTPLAALQTATVNPAHYLNRDQTTGTVDADKAADLVLLEANPLDSIENVRRIRTVIAAGQPLDRGALDRLLMQARTAAQQ